MKPSLRLLGLVLLSAGLAAAAQPPASSDLVQVVVTATAKKGAPPPIEQSTVVVFQEKQRRPVVDWVPLEGGRTMNLALMTDDSVGGGFGIQLDNLSSFVRALPANIRVAVIYARNGNATVAQNFTSDHAAATQAARLPLARPARGDTTSPALPSPGWRRAGAGGRGSRPAPAGRPASGGSTPRFRPSGSSRS